MLKHNARGHGEFVTHLVGSDGIWTPPLHDWTPNAWLYGWGEIATQTIVQGLAAYQLRAMYIEFENVADPDDPVSIPEIDRAEGVSYYNGLASSANRDYIRVPLEVSPALSVIPGYEDWLDEGYNNRAVLSAQTTGTTGVHGKTFSDTVNSKVFGIAVVAMPEFDDRTKDVVFARAYHAAGDQTVKPASSQVAATYRLEFK